MLPERPQEHALHVRIMADGGPKTGAEYAYVVAGIWVFALGIAGHVVGRISGRPVLFTLLGIGLGIAAMALQMSIAGRMVRRVGQAPKAATPKRWLAPVSAMMLGALLGAGVAFGPAPEPGAGTSGGFDPAVWFIGACIAGGALLGLAAWALLRRRAE